MTMGLLCTISFNWAVTCHGRLPNTEMAGVRLGVMYGQEAGGFHAWQELEMSAMGVGGDSPLRTLSYPIEGGPLTLNGSRSHS